MASFASASFSTSGFSASAFDLDAQQQVVSGGHPWIDIPRHHDELSEYDQRDLLREIAEPEPIQEAIAGTVAKVIKERKEYDEGREISAAMDELRAYLALRNAVWLDVYGQLIAEEYRRKQREIDEAQIVMLLFDM